MLNQAAVEALYSATYVENYLDCVENLPDDLQRLISRMRELDVTYQVYLKDIEQQQEAAKPDADSVTKRRTLFRIQQSLIAAQEVGDEKLQIVQQIQDLIENKARQLDVDFRNLDFRKDQENHEPNRENHNHHNTTNAGGGSGSGSTSAGAGERQSKRARRTLTENITSLDSLNTSDVTPPEPATTRSSSSAGNTSMNTSCNKKGNNTSKKKKRKSRQSQQQVQQQREDTPPPDDELAIDPDEPTYCLCDQISYGEMILCDNDLCPIEWFHFSCVALATKPKGKWFCPKCRGDRPNVMKPKAQFLKELERYNKEKEEKA